MQYLTNIQKLILWNLRQILSQSINLQVFLGIIYSILEKNIPDNSVAV